jgi:23S rRNA pseudouridine2604 synthase
VADVAKCSRREAELYLAGGWVLVDGQMVEEPHFLVQGQKVELHKHANLQAVEPVIILYNVPLGAGLDPATPQLLPPGLVNPHTRAPDDGSQVRTLRQHFVGLTQAAPLEAQATGLAILTQDFRLQTKLANDATTMEQEFNVEVEGKLISGGLELLRHGLYFRGRSLPQTQVSWQNEIRLRFAVKGVQPGQLVFMCQSVGLRVVNIKRLRVGRVSMGKLPVGQWRYLTQFERF